MKSIWTSLLFLHGHVTHRDLAWRPDAQPAKPKPLSKTPGPVLACCAAVWPRLMGPR